MAMRNIQVGHAPRVPQPHRLNVDLEIGRDTAGGCSGHGRFILVVDARTLVTPTD